MKWENNRVLLNLKKGASGIAYRDGNKLKGKEKQSKLKRAWEYFCNDSYWLAAPYKIYDPGVERKIMEFEDGSKGLWVTHTTGGETPGDTYVWRLSENGLPQSYRIWASVIPIGGLKASWEGWKTVSTGAELATEHRYSFFQFSVTDLKAGMEMEDVTERKNVFQPINIE
ncbi:MAG: hypothetical protein ABEH43_03880 [Flavobacteriales bacterium]